MTVVLGGSGSMGNVVIGGGGPQGGQGLGGPEGVGIGGTREMGPPMGHMVGRRAMWP